MPAGGAFGIDQEYDPVTSSYIHRNFDSIVWGERVVNQWMAGSEFFIRTPVNNGGQPVTSPSNWEHMVIVYKNDNSIKLYRNGIPYGNSYTQGSLVTYIANKYRLIFCSRHNQVIQTYPGSIQMAALYDFAMNDIQVTKAYENRYTSFGDHRCSCPQRADVDFAHQTNNVETNTFSDDSTKTNNYDLDLSFMEYVAFGLIFGVVITCLLLAFSYRFFVSHKKKMEVAYTSVNHSSSSDEC